MPMPASAIIDNFLDLDLRRSLLDWTLANQAAFQPASVFRGDGEAVDPSARANLKLADLGPAREAIGERLLEALPQLAGMVGTDAPMHARLELELTAYGDGAFYHPHADISVSGASTASESRLLSAVYYFHRQPKAFAGGELRLFRWGADEESPRPTDIRDIEPADNRLVGFLTWARHEVRPVRCPSGRFEDYRFAINCWYCGDQTGS